MTKPTVGIIGAGNMAQALFRPLTDWFHDFNVRVYTPSQTRAVLLANTLGGKAVSQLMN